MMSTLPSFPNNKQATTKRLHNNRKQFNRFGAFIVVASFTWLCTAWWSPVTVAENIYEDTPPPPPPLQNSGAIIERQREFQRLVHNDPTGIDNNTDGSSGWTPLLQKRQREFMRDVYNDQKRTGDIITTTTTTTTPHQHKETRQHQPRVFSLDNSYPALFSSSTYSKLLQTYDHIEQQQQATKHPKLDDNRPRTHSVDQSNLETLLVRQFTDDYQTHCVDMKEWQSKNYPVCNSMHELGILGGNGVEDILAKRITHLGNGSWRSAYVYRPLPLSSSTPNNNNNNNNNKVEAAADDDETNFVLKLFNLEDDDIFPFDPQAFEMHRIDALISQKMTSSPYFMDIYGYCGLSSLYERGITDLDDKAKAHHNLDTVSKWRYASHVAKALSDLDRIDYPNGGNATIMHGDIKPENVIIARDKNSASRLSSSTSTSTSSSSSSSMSGAAAAADGTVAKLSDFNTSILRKWNKTSNQPCPYYSHPCNLAWGGGYKPVEHAEGYTPLDESVDVFGFGAVIYFILVGINPYSQYTKGNETQDMKDGKLPPLPPQFSNYSYDDNYDDDDHNDTKEDDQKNSTINRDDNKDDNDSYAIRTMIRAIGNTMVLNPRDRPSAKQVLAYFQDSKNYSSS